MSLHEDCNIAAAYIGILWAIIIFILNCVFSFRYDNYELEKHPILLEIQHNLDTQLIYNLELKPSCEEGEEKLILGEWDGMAEGCNCSNTPVKRECTEFDYKNKCYRIAKQSPISYTKFNSNLLCIKRSGKSYLDLLKTEQIIPQNRYCPTNYISCGVIDTLGNLFCVKSGEKCPINKNDIKELNKYFNLIPEDENKYESFPIGYSNLNKVGDNREKILSIFKLGEKKPCINPTEKYWTYKVPYGPDNKECNTELNSKLYDERYEQILEKITKLKLYQENLIPDNGISGEDKDIDITLYTRNLLGFTAESISDFSVDKIVSKQNLSNDCNFILVVVSYVLMGLVTIPFVAIVSYMKDGSDCGYNSCESFCIVFIVIFSVITALTFILGCILIIIICVSAYKISSYLNIQGSDEYTNALIQILVDDASKYKTFSTVIVCFIFVLFIPLIVLLVNLIRYGKITSD
jgi:hypothetical protein